MSPDNKEPLVSAVITIFKADNYLEKCLEGDINKTYPNSEYVYSPNHKNGTLENINSYSIRQTRFDFFSNENFIKMSYNRNIAFINLNLNIKSPSIINIFHNGI